MEGNEGEGRRGFEVCEMKRAFGFCVGLIGMEVRYLRDFSLYLNEVGFMGGHSEGNCGES